jgi:hypothetical protein
VLGAFASNSSHAKANGSSPRSGLLCLPALSTVAKKYCVHSYSAMAEVVDYLLCPGRDANGLSARLPPEDPTVFERQCGMRLHYRIGLPPVTATRAPEM